MQTGSFRIVTSVFPACELDGWAGHDLVSDAPAPEDPTTLGTPGPHLAPAGRAATIAGSREATSPVTNQPAAEDGQADDHTGTHGSATNR
jgi:hypothetical protein